MKARKVVTRSGRGFRGYFPSKKLNRMVEYESLLERDAMYFFECSPGVKSYREQPELIMYEHEYQMKKYYPDFEVILNSGKTLHIEVKPAIKLKNEKLLNKYWTITQRYKNTKVKFLILTDEVIRYEPLLSNLKLLTKVRNNHLDISEHTDEVEKLLKINPNRTLSDIVTAIGYLNALAMLAHQKIYCNLFSDLLSPNNYVRLPKGGDHDTLYF